MDTVPFLSPRHFVLTMVVLLVFFLATVMNGSRVVVETDGMRSSIQVMFSRRLFCSGSGRSMFRL